MFIDVVKWCIWDLCVCVLDVDDWRSLDIFMGVCVCGVCECVDVGDVCWVVVCEFVLFCGVKCVRSVL